MAVTYFSTTFGIERLYWRRSESHMQTDQGGGGGNSFEVIKTANQKIGNYL